MRVFIERFILGILATVVVLLAFTNPMEWDWSARIIGIVVSVSVAGIASHFAGWDALHWDHLRSLWWLWLIIGLGGGAALSPFIVGAPPGVLIQRYGQGPGGALEAIVNSRSLLKYKDHFKMMLIVRVPYPDIDNMTDTAMEKSALYTITGGWTQLAITSIRQLRFRVSQGATGTISPTVHFLLVIIPNDIAPEQIRTLSDVARVGGKIMDARDMNPEFQTTPTPTPAPASPR
jgi:hypothetical protein